MRLKRGIATTGVVVGIGLICVYALQDKGTDVTLEAVNIEEDTLPVISDDIGFAELDTIPLNDVSLQTSNTNSALDYMYVEGLSTSGSFQLVDEIPEGFDPVMGDVLPETSGVVTQPVIELLNTDMNGEIIMDTNTLDYLTIDPVITSNNTTNASPNLGFDVTLDDLISSGLDNLGLVDSTTAGTSGDSLTLPNLTEESNIPSVAVLPDIDFGSPELELGTQLDKIPVIEVEDTNTQMNEEIVVVVPEQTFDIINSPLTTPLCMLVVAGALLFVVKKKVQQALN